MKLLKKDWLFDVKITMFIGLAILITFASVVLIMGKVAGVIPQKNAIQLYNKAYTMMALVVSFYPVMAFKGVCPQLGSDKVYMLTANLPMSRKEVFFKGLKSWLIIAPIVLILGGIGSVALSNGTGVRGELLFIAIFTPVLMIGCSIIIQLQIMSVYIFTLAKQIKGDKVVGGIVLFDFLLIALCSMGIRVFNIETAHNPWWIFGCGAFISIATLIIFIVAWRDVEKVYQ